MCELQEVQTVMMTPGLDVLHSRDLLLPGSLKEPLLHPQFTDLLGAEPLYNHWKVTVSLHFERVRGRICEGLDILLLRR